MIATAILLTALGGSLLPLEGTFQETNADATALQLFQQRVDGYLRLRRELGDRLKPLEPTASGADLAARQQALAAALRQSRADARTGDLMPPPVARLIASAVLEDFRRRNAAAEKASFSEIPNARRPIVNQSYPADAALPTVPPLLLKNLPPVPDTIQYRFYGRHLLLIDADAQIIVDYIPDVLPPS